MCGNCGPIEWLFYLYKEKNEFIKERWGGTLTNSMEQRTS
jgi:hypothetical protein